MPAVRKIIYSDFMGGLNNRQEAHLIAPNEAQTAQNCDLQSGALKPIKDVSSAITNSGGGATPSASTNFLAYAAGTFFISSADSGGVAQEYRFALNDGNRTYVTRKGRTPVVVSPAGGSNHMGLPTLRVISATASNGTGTLSAGVYKYRLTIETNDGMESNPSDALVVTVSGANDTVTVTWAEGAVYADPRATRVWLYRTKADGEHFYRVVSASNTATSAPDGSPDDILDTLHQLTWFSGGSGILSDHSSAPPLSVISNVLHTRSASGVSGGGIVFGAVASTAYWSKLGYPQYWPLINSNPLPEIVESIVSWQGTTFYFTANYIFQVSATSDNPLSADGPTFTQTKATFGVSPGLGRLTKLTPYGVLFMSRQGLAMFDGQAAVVISARKLADSYMQGLTYSAAEYFDGKYYLFHSTGTLRFDLRNGTDNLIVTTTTHVVRAACAAYFREPIVAETTLAPPLGFVPAIDVTEGGRYATGDFGGTTVTLSGGATATKRVGVHSVLVTNPGTTPYTSVPDVAFSASAVVAGTAKGYAVVSGGFVIQIVLTQPGYGYVAAPTVTISGGGGAGATASCDFTLTGVVMTASGSGYSSAPTVTIVAPTTAGYERASATARFQPFEVMMGSLVADSTRVFAIGGLVKDPINGDVEASARLDIYTVGLNSWGAGTSMAAARCNFTAVLLGNFVYVYSGGTAAAPFEGADSTLRIYNISAGTWDETRTSQAPGIRAGYAAATDGTNIFLFGGMVGGVTDSVLWRYNVTADTWTNLGSPSGGNRHGSTMIWDSTQSLFYIMGGLREDGTGGEATSGQTIITATNTGTFSTDTTGNTYGWIGRGYAGSVQYAAANGASTAWLLGGFTSALLGIGADHPQPQGFVTSAASDPVSGFVSDLWEIVPSNPAATRWRNTVDEVIGVGTRGFFGCAAISSEMYVWGGSTKDHQFTATFCKIDLDALTDNNRTPGVYVVQDSDSGAIRRFEGSSTDMAMTWVGREEVGERPGPMLTLMRARVDHTGSSIAVSTLSNGGAAVSQKTLSVGGTRTSSRFWFTSGTNKPRGQRVAVQIVSSGTNAAVYRMELDLKEDG